MESRISPPPPIRTFYTYIYIKRDTRYRPIFRVQNGTIHRSVLRDERERERGLRPKGHDLPFSINLRYANLIGRQPLCTTQGTAPLSDRPSAPSIRPSFRPPSMNESVPLIATITLSPAERNFVARKERAISYIRSGRMILSKLLVDGNRLNGGGGGGSPNRKSYDTVRTGSRRRGGVVFFVRPTRCIRSTRVDCADCQ